MRRALAALAGALLLVAPLGAQRPELVVRLKGFQFPIKLDTLASWHDVHVTPADAFVVVRHLLDSLRVPIGGADSASGVIFHRGFTARREMAGRPMHWAWSCGHGMGGDYADTWRVTVAYLVQVHPAAQGQSRVGIGFIAGAQSIEGAQTNPLPCRPTGMLERAIVAALREVEPGSALRRREPRPAPPF